jgi:hypothetical protein
MIRILIVTVLLAFLAGVNAYSECTTTVSGNINGQTWTLEGSPYCVDGDVSVAYLTIDPGVIVEFTGDFKFEVSGTLVAVGTEDALIEFKKSEGVAGWQGLSILDASQNSSLICCSISGYHNGGLKIYNSTPVVRKCYMIGNDGAESGSGLYVSLSTSSSDHLVLEDCTVSNNRKYDDGAGVYAELSAGSMVMRHCHITNNNSTYDGTGNRRGGGVIAYANGGLTFENCEISGNSVYSRCNATSCAATAYGGGIFVSDGNVVFRNCFLKSNLANATNSGTWSHSYAYGAAIHSSTGNLQLINSIISNNSASAEYSRGGGVYNSLATLDVTNGTIVSNVPYGIYNEGGVTQVANSIIYSNTTGQIYGIATVTYSDVQGGYDGEGNIDQDPLFKSITTYQVRCEYSPCVDTGNAYPWYEDSCFLPSCGGARNDMGAYGGPDACGWCAYGGYGTLGPCEVPTVGDFNGDGDVDAADLFIFSGNYGTE